MENEHILNMLGFIILFGLSLLIVVYVSLFTISNVIEKVEIIHDSTSKAAIYTFLGFVLFRSVITFGELNQVTSLFNVINLTLCLIGIIYSVLLITSKLNVSTKGLITLWSFRIYLRWENIDRYTWIGDEERYLLLKIKKPWGTKTTRFNISSEGKKKLQPILDKYLPNSYVRKSSDLFT